MAAPSGTVWGSTVGDYGRVGIHVKLTHTNTQTTRVITLWFWSKYGVSDSSNKLCYDAGKTSASTSKGSVSISTTVSSGSGWSTSNQVKLKEYSHTYSRGTSDWSESCAMSLEDIERVGGKMTATTKYTVPKLASYTVTYNANGGSGGPTSDTKYYGKTLTLSTKQPTKAGHKFQGWATSLTGSVVYVSGASYTANAGVTLYAVWKADTYTVSYSGNANSVSNVPSSDTKTYGVTLQLSTKIPTRTGHTFQGWATSSTGSVAYKAGENYTANASVTLHAVWKANTYTVTYNANGGSGAPSNQTKTHDTVLTLSGVVPTKTNYNFVGWGTSKDTNTATYKPGASYTANDNITLYAVWSLAYTKPRVSNVSVFRCDSQGNASDSGTSAKVVFSWATDNDVQLVNVKYKKTTESSSSWTPAALGVTPSGKNGDINTKIDGISTDSSYDIEIIVADGSTNDYTTTIPKSIAGAIYPIDFKYGGKGVSFGKPSEADGFHCKFDANFEGTLKRGNKTVLDEENYASYCAKASHSHDYLPLSGGTLSGNLIVGGYITTNGKTNYNDGKQGVYICNWGKVWLQPNSGGNPQILFQKNGDTTGYQSSIIYNTSNDYLYLSGATRYVFDNGVVVPNNNHIFFYNSSGAQYSCICLNNSNTLSIGYGGYENKLGCTALFGYSVYLQANTGGYIYIQSSTVLNHQLTMGTNTASDGGRYYINNVGNGRFNTLKYTSSSAYSSRRYKNDIDYKDKEYWHDAIMNIKPCIFKYKNDSKTKHIGLIAEDLVELIPELVGIDEEGLPSSVEYTALTIPLIGEVQLLNGIVEEQGKRIDVLEEKSKEQDEIIANQQKEINNLKDQIQQLKELVAKLVS